MTSPPPAQDSFVYVCDRKSMRQKGTFTGEMALSLKCVSLRKVEKMLSVSVLWRCDAVGGRTDCRKEPLSGV